MAAPNSRKGKGTSKANMSKPAPKSVRVAKDPDGDNQPRGGGKPWTTPRQCKFLSARIEAFEEARQTRKKVGLTAFWRMTIQEFLKKWPIDEDLSKEERDDEVEGITKRIKVWFNNHCRSTTIKSKIDSIINFSKKKNRRRSLVQTFSRHYGDVMVIPVLTERWEKHEKCPGPGTPVPLWFRNQLTREIYDSQPDEMKEEVSGLREADLEDVVEEDGDYQYLLEEEGIDEEEVEQRQNIIALQRNIDALPDTMVTILEQVRRETGFMGVCAFFGSEPKAGGNIITYSTSLGETPAGTTMMEYIDGFKESFEGYATEFGKKAICPSERAVLCMPGTEDNKNYGPNRSSSTSHRSSSAPSRNRTESGSNLRKRATLNAGASKSRRRGGSDDSNADLRNNDNNDTEENDQNAEEEDTELRNDNNNTEEPGKNAEEEDKTSEDEQESQELLDLLASTSEEMPVWLSTVIKDLYFPTGTELWTETLRAFIKFEEALGFPAAKRNMYRLSSTCRPNALSQYINNHRKKDPILDDVDAFADEVYIWWIRLQPPSRRKNHDTSISDARSLRCLASEVSRDEVWEDLRKGSINGMFGMMCCLAWWLQLDSGLDDDDLMNILQDVMWVLEVMSEVPEDAIQAARKRKAEEEESSPRKKAWFQPSRSQPPPSRSQPPTSRSKDPPARTQPSRSDTARSRSRA